MSFRQVTITIPADNADRVDDVREFLVDHCQLKNTVYIPADRSAVFMFFCNASRAGQVLNMLEKQGVGIHYGLVAVAAVQAIKPVPETSHAEAVQNVRDASRLAVEEIYFTILAGAQMSFDYLAYVIIAGIIAAVGLATNSAVMVVSAMLVSPLMGPILALTFGFVIRDWPMLWVGLRNELFGMITTFGVGLVMGVIFAPFGVDLDWPTEEMTARGKWVSILVGLGFAVPSGAGVALAVTGGGVNSLVGVAISASLLPPIVNSGMALSFAYLGPHMHDSVDGSKYLKICLVSMLLFLMNVAVIFVMASFFFHLKAVAPVRFKSSFWQELPKIWTPAEEWGPQPKPRSWTVLRGALKTGKLRKVAKQMGKLDPAILSGPRVSNVVRTLESKQEEALVSLPVADKVQLFDAKLAPTMQSDAPVDPNVPVAPPADEEEEEKLPSVPVAPPADADADEPADPTQKPKRRRKSKKKKGKR